MNYNVLLIILAGTLFFSCTQPTEKEANATLDAKVEAQIDDLIAQMTTEEKVAQMRMFHAQIGIDMDDNDRLVLSDKVKKKLELGIGGIKNPGEHFSPRRAALLNNQLQTYIIEHSRLNIPTFFVTESYNGVDAEGCTRFARPINMAATWNRELVKKVYDAVGREARLRGLHLTHSPEADIIRDPRFGRMSEAFSEDTYLTTQMIIQAITGIQGDYEGLKKTHIGAVAKHFAGYAQVAGGRNFASIELSPRTLIDEIFPPFEAAVKEARTLGVMASHGDINGVASHANPELLTETLRNQWGFSGYVVSDANDVGRLHYFMKIAETPEDAVIKGLKAGVDVDLYAEDAYALLPEMLEKQPELMPFVEQAVRRVLRTKFRLGLFDHPFTNVDEAEKFINAEGTQNLAKLSDLESIILLKNEGILPLDQGSHMTIALVGPLLNKETKQVFKSISKGNVKFISEKGYALTDGQKSIPELNSKTKCMSGIQKIVQTARKADKIILFAGGDEFTAKEAFFNGALGDRKDIIPVSYQDELILALKKLNKPVIIVLKHRRTLAVNSFQKNADAMIDCWDLSELGDIAIAKTLFGLSNPSGKLPVTVPRYIGQLPYHYSQKEINYKKGYLFTENTPLYPFGFGLSYSKFKYSNVQLSDSILHPNTEIKVSVDVKNVSKTRGKEVVQLYIKDLFGCVVRPMKELKGFEKIELAPGEQNTVTFTITPKMLEFTGLDMNKVVEPGDFHAMVGTSSEEYLKVGFKYLE